MLQHKFCLFHKDSISCDRYFIASMIVWTLPPLGAMVWYCLAYYRLYSDKITKKWHKTSNCLRVLCCLAGPFALLAVFLGFTLYVRQIFIFLPSSYNCHTSVKFLDQ